MSDNIVGHGSQSEKWRRLRNILKITLQKSVSVYLVDGLGIVRTNFDWPKSHLKEAPLYNPNTSFRGVSAKS